MNFRILYSILCLFFVTGLFSRNITVKRDSTKQKWRINEYLKLNIQVGAIVYHSYSNKPYRCISEKQKLYPWYNYYMPESFIGDGYTNPRINENHSGINSGINVGFNFLIGNKPHVKIVFGANYLRAKGEYYYYYSDYQKEERIRSSSNLRYTSVIDFINVVIGPRFTIGKRFQIEPLVSYNLVANSSIRATGYITRSLVTYSGGTYYSQPHFIGETYLNNELVANQNVNSTVSFCPKLSYEFNIKQQKFGVYFGYNMSIKYCLPWFMGGITYYPFKKLR